MAKRKPGKYDHLLPKLPKLPPSDLAYQQKVEDEKNRLRICPTCNGKKTVDDHSLHVPPIITKHTCGSCDGTGRRKMNGNTLAELYVIARADVETVAEASFRANLEIEAVSQLLIASQDAGDADWGAFGASDKSLKMTNGDTVRTQPEIYPVPKDKSAFREWCYANGLRSKMELPVKPMTDLAKLRLLNGESEPTGLTIYVRTKIVYVPLKTEVTSSTETSSDSDTESPF